jgi:hypothetical protein
MTALPTEKQVEVYDFAKFLKKNFKPIHKNSFKKNLSNKKYIKSVNKSSILDIIGIGASGCSDISLHHDKYLYE